MKLTKIKRRNLNRGDLYTLELDSIHGVPQVYVALVDGVTAPINVANETIYRIDVPDNTSDSTSEYIKILEAKIIRQSRYITKQFDNIDDRDKHVEELMVEVNDLVRENDGLEEDKNRMYTIMDRQRVTMRQQMDDVVELRMKIFDGERREDLVTTDLEHRLEECRQAKRSLQINVSTRDDRIKELEEMLCDVDNPYAIAIDESIKHDLELLDILLKTINPLLRDSNVPLSNEMKRLCNEVSEFRRKHNIVG